MQRSGRLSIGLSVVCLFCLAAAGCDALSLLNLPVDAAVLGDSEPQTEQLDQSDAAARTLAGVWEGLESRAQEGHWDDPSAALAVLFEAMGNPFQQFGIMNAGERVFMVIDSSNALVVDFTYVAAENIVYVGTPSENPFLGLQAESQEDGSLVSQRSMEPIGEDESPIAISGNLRMTYWPNADGTTWAVELVGEFTATAIFDVPADPNTGTPALTAGERAVWIASASYTLTPSYGPAELFPGATWEIKPEDQ